MPIEPKPKALPRRHRKTRATFAPLTRPQPIRSRPGGFFTKPLMRDRQQAHPGQGLTPETIIYAYRQAEHGWPSLQVDLFSDIVENDGHLRSLIEARNGAVSGRQMQILPGGSEAVDIEAADALKDILDNTNFDDMTAHIMDGLFDGWACSEIDWTFSDGLFRPTHFLNVPARRFRFDPQTDEIRLLNHDGDTTGELLMPGKWVIWRNRGTKTTRSGLLRTLAWFALFKRMGMRDWIIVMEKFGIPSVIGHYDADVALNARQLLTDALEDLGEAGHAVLPMGTSVHFEWAQGNNSSSAELHRAIIDKCEAQMSKLVNGAILNVDGGGPGSFAQARTHENRSFSLSVGDARKLAKVFKNDVARPFVAYNGFEGARLPRLVIQVSPDQDPTVRAQVAATLVKDVGLKLSAKQLYEEHGFRPPEDDEDAVTGPPQNEPNPAGENFE